MNDAINLLDVVVLTTSLPHHHLSRGEIGAVVECYADNTYDVEFVAQDGYTYALITLPGALLIPLREKPVHDARELIPAMG